MRKNNFLWGLVAVLCLLLMWVALSGCEAAPLATSDSPQTFEAESRIPVDENIYTVTGEVIGDVNSLSQVHAQGSGSVYGSGGFVYGSSSYSMWQDGKGFVRLKVEAIAPELSYIPVGSSVIIKTTDKKAISLLPGDKVVFKCRAQYENVAATKNNEKLDVEKYGTWELDYCRMVDPRIGR